MYRQLDASKITQTLQRLHARISERFAESGLSNVCAEVIRVSETTAARVDRIFGPYLALRIAVFAVIAGGVAAQVYAAKFVPVKGLTENATSLVQGLEAAVNLLILFGGAAWFLVTLEERLKRARALKALHELRSLAHVIDMHQLTKDPTFVLNPDRRTTASSPQREMNQFELTRYLDYCAEMLALIGKLAALYAERSRDSVVIEAVNDLESLAGNLGRKIWQKIMILGQLDERKTG